MQYNCAQLIYKQTHGLYRYDVDVWNVSDSYLFEHCGIYVICRSNTIIYNELYDSISAHIASYFYNSAPYVFLSNGLTDREPIIVYVEKVGGVLRTLEDIVRGYVFNNSLFGTNADIMTPFQRSTMYMFLGKFKIPLNHFGFDQSSLDQYINFVMTGNPCNRKYNAKRLIRCYYYCMGRNNINISDTCGDTFIASKREWLTTETVLLVSKRVMGYGGNQKTSRQILELLDRYYSVDIFSNTIVSSSKKPQQYSLSKDYICDTIPNSYVLPVKNAQDIIDHIMSTPYKFILNNKLNEFCSLLPSIYSKQPIYAITHNSMDPFNKMLLDNAQYFSKIFTINRRHSELLLSNGLSQIPSCQVLQYLNYVDSPNHDNVCSNRHLYHFNKCITFVGRLSKEKNVKLLIDAVTSDKYCTKVRLNIIGDCGGTKQIKDSEYYVDHPSVCYHGKLSHDSICRILQTSDYLVLPSYTEGIPFSILEAMSIGVPCIYSAINGSDEIIDDGKTGFTFPLAGYSDAKDIIDSWAVYDMVDAHYEKNVENLQQCISRAYDISIDMYNQMSIKCADFANKNYSKHRVFRENALKLEL